MSIITSENIAAWLEKRHLNQLLVLVDNPLVGIGRQVLSALGGPIFTHLYAGVGGALLMLIVLVVSEARGEGYSANKPRLQKPDMTLAEAVRYIGTEAAWAHEGGIFTYEDLRLDLTDQLFHGALEAFGRVHEPFGSSGPMFRIGHEFWQNARIDVGAYLQGDDSNTVFVAAAMGSEGWSDVRVFRSALENCFPRPKPVKRKPILGGSSLAKA